MTLTPAAHLGPPDGQRHSLGHEADTWQRHGIMHSLPPKPHNMQLVSYQRVLTTVTQKVATAKTSHQLIFRGLESKKKKTLWLFSTAGGNWQALGLCCFGVPSPFYTLPELWRKGRLKRCLRTMRGMHLLSSHLPIRPWRAIPPRQTGSPRVDFNSLSTLLLLFICFIQSSLRYLQIRLVHA